ncbi:AAA family ATPase [Halobellus marinus]|uniref:hypothetical protein n=1 Tax=Halobellus TaxID=1073986 RepID=UPI0028A60A55|nr:hypothetical protein [Halobellus sp. DFY28]
MTDATLSVTQSRLTAFTRDYLQTIGASVHEDGSRWHVNLPGHIDVTFGDGSEFDVVLEANPSENSGQNEFVPAPESEFAQQLLDEAISMASVGRLSVTDELSGGEYQYPDWIIESDLQVVDAEFTPYYDREAVFAVVQVGVETVSEYQTQFLEAVTIDASSQEELAEMSETILQSFYDPKNAPRDGTPEENAVSGSIEVNTFEEIVTECQQTALDNVRGAIDDLRESASRAADAEFDEYRQLQNQQLGDLREEIESVTNQLQNVADDVDTASSHEDRVEALEKREELQAKIEELEEKRSDILESKQQGFEDKRREIYHRHQLEVRTKPVAATLVSYERGEIELQLANSKRSETMRVPYGAGAGCLDTVTCINCQSKLSSGNPVQIGPTGIQCYQCR